MIEEARLAAAYLIGLATMTVAWVFLKMIRR